MSITLRAYPCGHEIAPQMLSDIDAWIIEQITSGKSQADRRREAPIRKPVDAASRRIVQAAGRRFYGPAAGFRTGSSASPYGPHFAQTWLDVRTAFRVHTPRQNLVLLCDVRLQCRVRFPRSHARKTPQPVRCAPPIDRHAPTVSRRGLRAAVAPTLADPFRLALTLAVNVAIVVGIVGTAIICAITNRH